MQKGWFRIALFLLLVIWNYLVQSETALQERRLLLKREQNYLKKQPMSQELRELIDKFRNRKIDSRTKRSNSIPENQMYIVQNGQLVPFKESTRFARLNEPGYNVLPLVLPLEERDIKDRAMKPRDLTDPPASTESTPGATSSESEQVVLQKILVDIESLMHNKENGGAGHAEDEAAASPKEGVICSVNGSWSSEAAGMRFDIDIKEQTHKKFNIHVAEKIPPSADGFLCDSSWAVYGELPFSHSGVILVLAVHAKDKHIAMFIGECRVCEGSDTISGTWLVGRSSRDCKDQKAAHKVLSDIWRKEETHALRKKHLKAIGIKTPEKDK